MSRDSDNRKRRFWLRALTILLLIACLIVLATGLLLKKGIEIGEFTIGTAAISDFSLQWQVLEPLRIQLAIDNVLDESYDTAVGFPDAGRFFRAGLTLRH